MVQIHPSLPLKNTDSSRVLVARNPWQIGAVHLQPESHWRFHRIPFGFGLPVLGMMGLGVDMFRVQPKSDRFDFQAHVVGECSMRRFPK